MAERKTPLPAHVAASTYRLQFHRGFRFADARVVVPYLAALGVTDCYSSPYLKASPGSTHGYAICDHNQLNPEVGCDEEYAAFTAALAAHDMGQIADFVPNHMGVDEAANPWWRDVLENGPSSPFAAFFDIDWEPTKDELKDKVLLPILGDQYGSVLERGELRLAFEEGAFTVRYFDHNLPINPRQVTLVLQHELDGLQRDLGEENPELAEYLSVITALRNLPIYTQTDPARVAERRREKELARQRLQRLAQSSPRIRQHIQDAVRVFNGGGGPESFDSLHALLEAEPYRLAYWRTAAHEINYRRFFDINQLAGLRVDDARVFAAAHRLMLRLIAEEKVTGIRIDHIDGLFDPMQYLERLQGAIRERRVTSGGADDAAPFYVVTEKILSTGESLPTEWPVAGTSGYDFLNDLNGLFVDRPNQRTFIRIYRRFCRVRSSFAEHVYASKKLIMDGSMASELNVLAQALNHLSERDRRTRDFTLNSLRDVLQDVVAGFPIYRTYVSPAGHSDADERAIETAIQRARRRNPTMEPSTFDFVRSVLLPDPSTNDYHERLEFAMKFQQYTGPLQAKGVEDTAFYRYNLLLSLNEVGGDPERFGRSPAEFHTANQRRHERWPRTMIASATHDTKRGEDVRARLNVLSELPDEWGRHLSAWARVNAGNRSIVDAQPAPDRNDEYRFYQTLLGVWPPGAAQPARPQESFVQRIREYMLKAVREAKVHTSWTAEHHAYEAAVTRFVERTLTGPSAPRFLDLFLPFQNQVARLGMINSLAQVVLKTASPGVPDFYQGTELWDLSLVDPDNRRPVDYRLRQRLLAELEPVLSGDADRDDQRLQTVCALLTHWPDGRIKLYVTATALRLRRRLTALFLTGEYEPLAASGERADHIVALARRDRQHAVIAVVPRLLVRLTSATHFLPLGTESWGETWLPLPEHLAQRAYRDELTGVVLQPGQHQQQVGLAIASILHTCPVALLVSDSQGA
jgi:(1->4)-alpha-D-glucan 1-alpha-D-glucosylmutase